MYSTYSLTVRPLKADGDWEVVRSPRNRLTGSKKLRGHKGFAIGSLTGHWVIPFGPVSSETRRLKSYNLLAVHT